MLSKKYYKAIAYTLSLSTPVKESEFRDFWTVLCDNFAEYFKRDNPRFDKYRFTQACDYDYWKTNKAPY
jgi:hypothetical protein